LCEINGHNFQHRPDVLSQRLLPFRDKAALIFKAAGAIPRLNFKRDHPKIQNRGLSLPQLENARTLRTLAAKKRESSICHTFGAQRPNK